jgi:hypothetical protein
MYSTSSTVDKVNGSSRREKEAEKEEVDKESGVG